MRRVAGLVLVLGFVGIMALVSSCRKDIILIEPDTIKGDYIGTFTYKIGSQVAEEQFVIWRFTDISLNMWYDEDRDIDENGEGASRKFCDVQGEYTLGSHVEIDTVRTTSFEICNKTRNPSGAFTIDRSTDTLVLLQVDSDNEVTKTIRLLKE